MSTPPPSDAPDVDATGETIVQPTERKFEGLERYERIWLRVGLAMLVVFAVLSGVTAFRNVALGSHGSMQLATDQVSMTPPFNHPGTYKNKDGSWSAVTVAYAFGFLPKADLVVPEDVDVKFYVASVDVVHGFQIPGVSNVNLMVLPGHVSQVTQRFDTPGRYIVLCNEYCGSGHHFMTTHIRVLKKGEDPANPPPLPHGIASTTSVVEPTDDMKDMPDMDHGDNA